MHAPIFSTVTLLTELLITASVLTIIYRAYYQGIFMRALAYLVLGYEFLFNITYMSSRLITHPPTEPELVNSPLVTGLAIFHGTFSLIMFITLVTYFVLAIRAFGRGVNYFQAHPRFTAFFVGAWLVSIFSGMLFFYLLYIAG